MNVTTKMQKWGNSNAVRLPKAVVSQAKLPVNQQLTITVRGSSIILTPVKAEPVMTLEAMLKGVTPELVKDQFEWDGDMGLEADA